ncbi:hypothetical protein CHARACLAT_009076 [Characodon lateralis]|uniref:Uncharacterized protein n=1 Tax=Characodon lateralis TaxID=208331 RepID=A0ABU7CQY0_9TELE|nr:hypothetical protein [Characodon lateralis]
MTSGSFFGENRCCKCVGFFCVISSWGVLRPALLHNRDSASSTTATIKQPTLGTKTHLDTVPNLLYEAFEVFSFARRTSNFALKTQIDVEHQLVFLFSSEHF